jgi:hypothetical protein
MTPTDLASKIAEEVFRTIEREKAIVKAEIVEAVEKVVLHWQAAERMSADAEKLSSAPVFGKSLVMQLLDAGSIPNRGKPEWVNADAFMSQGVNLFNVQVPIAPAAWEAWRQREAASGRLDRRLDEIAAAVKAAPSLYDLDKIKAIFELHGRQPPEL